MFLIYDLLLESLSKTTGYDNEDVYSYNYYIPVFGYLIFKVYGGSTSSRFDRPLWINFLLFLILGDSIIITPNPDWNVLPTTYIRLKRNVFWSVGA